MENKLFDNTLDELQDEVNKLNVLLNDRQPGMFTWHEFLNQRLTEIYRIITKLLLSN